MAGAHGEGVVMQTKTYYKSKLDASEKLLEAANNRIADMEEEGFRLKKQLAAGTAYAADLERKLRVWDVFYEAVKDAWWWRFARKYYFQAADKVHKSTTVSP